MNLTRIFLLIIFLVSGTGVKAQKTLTDSLFHPDSLRYWVNLLADDSLNGRFSGSKEALAAANIISQEFMRAGIKPLAGNEGYFMPLGKYGNNVIGGLQGKSLAGQVVIFSAHYDHVGTTATNPYPNMGGKAYVEDGDEIYNGANDNASGVSALIALAKYFKQINIHERTLLFVAFAGEEQGLLGSQYMASQFEPDSIVALINIEMIGRKNANSGNPFITGQDYSDLQKILNKNLHQYNSKKYGKVFFENDRFLEHVLFMRSDNYPFAFRKIPAHTISTTSPLDEFYHNLNDEPSTLDYKLMSRIVEAIAISTTGLVKGYNTPARIKGLK